MRCMKMPRSQCESENVQFVQELAEVDGPFEAPININFRDLIKLELPSLIWNRGDTCPKKMKLTNTGHTVIVSGKWKCERPYLTGGPLLGKYVFSQIHFHWGQDDCKGSEHQICGEGFPLEMHVAHFKTEYLTQENALREKDGMVVVVYLFKLQEEPNQSLKTIINSLSNVKQPSTSQVIDPRPILSLCHPFTDDYFMYWGSVVTSTCAHILLWLICREPFGISREQVKEFRKIMDSSQQPICRNSKEVQPIHKRNVFHVNASKHLDQPLLPIRKLLGCYCKGNEDKDSVKHSNDCHCHGTSQNQEDVEGRLIEYMTENHCMNSGDRKVVQSSCFANQTFFVHTTHVQSVSILLKRCGSDPLENYCHFEKLRKMKSEGFKEIKKKKLKLISQSCCFIPLTEVKKIQNMTKNTKIQKRRKLFHSVHAFSQIMRSLESLKNHTFRKLKEIESINQEIKEMKPFCQDREEKKWIRKIEKVMTRQKGFIIKSSQGCLGEIRKLAKDFNFDKFFDAKALTNEKHKQKVCMSINKETTNEGLLCYGNYIKGEEMLEIEKTPSKYGDINNAIHFSTEAQKVIESFFEDIKDSEDLKESVKNDLNLKNIKSFYSRQGNSNSRIHENKNYITEKMFTLGNLGNRFFTEVTTEDYNMDENQWKVEKKYEEEMISTFEISETKKTLEKYENLNTSALEEEVLENNEETDLKSKTEALIPLHRADVGILLSKTIIQKTQTSQTMIHQDLFLSNEEKIIPNLENHSDSEILSSDQKSPRRKKSKKVSLRKSSSVRSTNLKDLMCERLLHALEEKVLLSKRSGSDFSTESTEIQRMIFAKVRQSKKDFWEHKKQKSSGLFRVYSKRFYNKANCKKFEGYYIQKKNPKVKKRKSHKCEKMKRKILYDLSSTSKDEANQIMNKQKWKRVTKAKFKLEIQKTEGSSTSETSIENFLISPDKKRLKLECKIPREYSSRESSLSPLNNKINLTDKETRTIITNQEKGSPAETGKAVKHSVENFSEEQQKFTPESTMITSRNISRSTVNKSLRASSAGSKLSHVISEELLKPYTSDESLKVVNNILEKEIPNFTEVKLLPKNKSLSNLNKSPGLVATYPELLESINAKRKSNRESLIPRWKLEFPKQVEERLKSINSKELSRDVSKETHEELVGEKDSKGSSQIFPSYQEGSPEFECKVTLQSQRFFTTDSSQVDNELLPLNQEQLEKDEGLKRIYTKKFHVTEESSSKLSLSLQEFNEEHLETLQRRDSNKSLTKDSSKENEDFLTPDNKDFHGTVSYSGLKKDPICRSHSAESLPSQTKSLKRKNKKRPHCSKKNSRHYLRKNSSISKRTNKTEKQLNFLNFTDEEQLKIISVNVVKYLKEKFKEKNDESEKDYLEQDISFIINKEMIPKMKDLQEKKEKSIEKIPDQNINKKLNKKSEINSGNAPTVKVEDKKEEKPKRIGVLRKPKVIKTQVEIPAEKIVPDSPKPANNFIKLNKQLASKYRKLQAPPAKKPEPKTAVKPKPESRPSIANSKTKEMTPEKKKREIPSANVKTKEQIGLKPQAPRSPNSPPVSPKKNVQKESQLKTPRSYKKPGSNAASKETSGKTTSPESIKKSNQSINQESNSETLPSFSVSQKIPRPKKYSNINSTTATDNPVSKTNADPLNENVKDDQSVFCYTPESQMQEEAKNDNLFEKELEYFIKLQMYLNNDLTKNLENPLEYEKSKLLHQNHQERSSITENLNVNYPGQNFDSFIKRIIKMETKDLMKCSSTTSELTEEMAKHSVRKLEMDNKSTKNVSVKTVRESSNFGSEISGLGKEKQEETNSDSSYDCKISITLNTNPNEGDNTVQSYDLDNWLGENSNSQITCLEGSSSQSTVMKPLTKKRNEGDIPIEMKEKLLEILEGEINREMAIKCGGSLVSWKNSNDWLTLKEEESVGNNQSRSTMNSCDNIEIFSQISNTMKQYLTYMKQAPDRESQD